MARHLQLTALHTSHVFPFLDVSSRRGGNPNGPHPLEAPPTHSSSTSPDAQKPPATDNPLTSEGSDSALEPTAEPSEALSVDEPEMAEEMAPAEPLNYVKLTGRIWRVKSGFVFARTPVGTLTLFSKKGLKTVKGAQKVTVWTHDNNIVVDFHRKKDPTPLRRFISGIPTATSSSDSSLQLWTPDGGFSLPPASSDGS